MKPLIGICVNHSMDDTIGTTTKLGLPNQEWQLLASDYIYSIEQAGGIPVIIPVVKNLDTIKPLLRMIDGILFTGGQDINPARYGQNPENGLEDVDPVRDDHEFNVLEEVYLNTETPILGICRGLQLINVFFGGTLYQDLKKDWENGFNHKLLKYPKYFPSHKAEIKQGSKLYRLFEQNIIGVNSFNHQGVKELGDGLICTMKAIDGMVEGIELEGERFIVAVQWHPEMMVEKNSFYLKYFEKFVDICNGRRI